jgi:hypothetical protein
MLREAVETAIPATKRFETYDIERRSTSITLRTPSIFLFFKVSEEVSHVCQTT